MKARKVDSGAVTQSEPQASGEVQNTAPLSAHRRPFDLSAILSRTSAEVNAVRRAVPKHEIEPREVTREKKKQSKETQSKAFRDAVWKRDESRCRATGETLVRQGTTDPKKLGEVDHSIPRSLAPDRIYDVSNGLLLSKHLNRLRKRVCPEAPEHRYFDYSGPDNRALKQTFIWRDRTGKVIRKERG